MRSQIMYIENKDDIAALDANIGRVTFSKTGKTLKYGGKEFQSMKGVGFKANYREVHTGEQYWISGCRKDGNDGLYRITVHIDEDVREEYWETIREMPERKNQSSFISTGKHRAGGKEIKNRHENF